jgi:hypothetical protein
MTDDRIGRYQLGELVAVEWSADMAQRFPNVSHIGCRQEVWHDGAQWQTYDPPHCQGWHCNRCGAATNSYGHHDCPDRPTP